jgi:site-specific DNA recombinase
MRAAVYARYSTDMQSSASIADQVRVCRQLCEANGWTVVDIFADEAMSGATHLRPDFQRMQQAAIAGTFDVIIAEALDRLSRDQEHIAGLHKRMQYLGIKIVTKTEGEINELHIGLGGTMSALFLRQLAVKTHRGLEGRVRAKKSAGGISYGYRVDRQILADGTFSTGDRTINPEEAAIVQRIFSEYDRGRSARSIARDLNRDGIAPPRSGGKGNGQWSFSTISGNWKRGTGILNNQLYIGKLVWNRQRYVKDPDTGKRQARLNPPKAWVTEDIQDLRIIDDALWERVKTRQGATREKISLNDGSTKLALERARRPRYLLSGLLSCGCCGAGYILVSKSRYGCSAARNSGTCGNRKTIERSSVEDRILTGLRDKMLHPDLLAAFIEGYQQDQRLEQQEAVARRGTITAKLDRVKREIDNIVSAIANGMYHPSIKAKLDTLEAEKQRLAAEENNLPTVDPVVLHPNLALVYKRKVESLVSALNSDAAREEAAEILRGLIQSIVLHPDNRSPDGHRIELSGELGSILQLGHMSDAKNTKARHNGGPTSQLTLVAGAGFEPATFRL